MSADTEQDYWFCLSVVILCGCCAAMRLCLPRPLFSVAHCKCFSDHIAITFLSAFQTRVKRLIIIIIWFIIISDKGLSLDNHCVLESGKYVGNKNVFSRHDYFFKLNYRQCHFSHCGNQCWLWIGHLKLRMIGSGALRSTDIALPSRLSFCVWWALTYYMFSAYQGNQLKKYDMLVLYNYA